MRKAKLFTLAACLLGVVGMSFVSVANESSKVAAGDAEKGKELSATCAACHGGDGNSVNPVWPKLAGQGEAYIIKQLEDFRTGKRTDAVMGAQAKGIKSDEDVRHLAAYFSSQKTKLASGNKDKVMLGEAIYRGGNLATGVAACSACHGPNGVGNTAAKFPRVSGQHAKYIVMQLKIFKSGKRSNDTNKIMRGVVKNMTDEEMEAVAEYMQGLR